MINDKYKIGDVVVNKDFCEYEPFELSNEHFKGVTARNKSWFDSLEHSKMKLTLKQLIEVIEDRKKQADKNDIQSPENTYCLGYGDALGELLEFIEENK